MGNSSSGQWATVATLVCLPGGVPFPWLCLASCVQPVWAVAICEVGSVLQTSGSPSFAHPQLKSLLAGHWLCSQPFDASGLSSANWG